MSTTPRTLQQLVEHASDADLNKAAQRAHVELSDRVEEQVARCTALEATAPTNRDLGTLTALYKGVATELAAGDEIAAAARASDADIAALHRSFKSIEERHSSFVPSVVDALREGNVPVSAASLLEDLLAAHIGASTVLRNHLLAHAPVQARRRKFGAFNLLDGVVTCSRTAGKRKVTHRNSRTPARRSRRHQRTARAPRASTPSSSTSWARRWATRSSSASTPTTWQTRRPYL